MSYSQQFSLQLKRHLWSRLTGTQDRDPPRMPLEVHRQITIKRDKVYPSSGMRTHYTSYDTTKTWDYIAADKHANIIMSSRTGTMGQHIYARVLGLFHLHARNGSQKVERIDVVWVQYYAVVNENSVGGRCYPKLQLPTTRDSYDFIDPHDISRGCHIIPDFASGRRTENSQNHIYKYYFVNM